MAMALDYSTLAALGMSLVSGSGMPKATSTTQENQNLRKLDFETLFPQHRMKTPSLRVVSWNLLAPNYAFPKSFPDVGTQFLSSEWRKPRLRQVIESLGADILCFQEMQFPAEWKSLLGELGYDMCFGERPLRMDGCALAWRTKHWNLKQARLVNFDNHIPSKAARAVQVRFARRNIGLIVELGHLQSGSSLVVATTHLYWGAEHEDVRAWQLTTLVGAMKTMMGDESQCRHYLLCGDLNLLPGSESHKLLKSGEASFPRTLRRVDRFLFDRDISKAARPLRLLGVDASVEPEAERRRRGTGRGGLVLPELFSRAASEGRVVVSGSRSLLDRRDCPLGAFFFDARAMEESIAEMCLLLSVQISLDRLFTRCVKCNGVVSKLDEEEAKSDRIRRWGPPAGMSLYECASCHQVYWFSTQIGSAAARAQQLIHRILCLIAGEQWETEALNGAPINLDGASSCDPMGLACSAAAARIEAFSKSRAVDDPNLGDQDSNNNDGNDNGDHGEIAEEVGQKLGETTTARVPEFKNGEYFGPGDQFICDGGGSLSLALELHSAYEDLEDLCATEDERFTNSKYGFHGLIDYMWLSPSLHERTTARLDLPRVAELKSKASDISPSLLGASWPSDHWPVAVDVELPG